MAGLTPKTRERLVSAVAAVQRMVETDAHLDQILHAMTGMGAASRYQGGTYFVRLCGVTGSCTVSAAQAVPSWLRAAERRLGA